MNRRKFITTLGIAAGAAPLVEARGEDQQSATLEYPVSLKHCVIPCEMTDRQKLPNIQLEVQLSHINPAFSEQEKPTRITQFKLTWDGQNIPIHERFWNDLENVPLKKSAKNPEAPHKKIDLHKVDPATEEVANPKLMLSADLGTVLIEWRLDDGCCGVNTTLRWIVSKNGHVLRHRHSPFNPC